MDSDMVFWLQVGFGGLIFLLQTVTAIVGTLLFLALNRHLDKQDQKEASQDTKIDTVTQDLAGYREEARELFPSRDEYVLKMSNFDNRLLDTSGKVSELSGEVRGYMRRGES